MKRKSNILKEYVVQGVSEIRVLILTSERTRQFMKLFVKFVKVL
jgi:hypothetical protein